ncbi:MAG TPA: hypothetical protein VNO33_03375 [Kofleriaceae bacterium]|nr:hypothetical protein [Kofleriaceae bacterium]
MLGRGLILALVLTAGARAAVAQPDFEAAKQHYQAAEQASAAGKHSKAAREYGIAYDITKDPVLFFKIGQAYDRAGDCTTAKVYYLRYLKEGKPEAEYRQRTEALIANCKNRQVGSPVVGPVTGGASGSTGAGVAGSGAAGSDSGVAGSGTGTGTGTSGADSGSGAGTDTRAAPPAEPKRAPAPRPAPAPAGAEVGVPAELDLEPPGWERTAAWTSVGVAVALGTTAAVLGLSASSREEDVQNLIEFRDTEGDPARYTGPTRDRYRDLVDEGKRLETLSIVALAATGGAAAASVVFFLLDGARTSDEESARLTPTVGPGAAGLSWSGSF